MHDPYREHGEAVIIWAIFFAGFSLLLGLEHMVSYLIGSWLMANIIDTYNKWVADDRRKAYKEDLFYPDEEVQ